MNDDDTAATSAVATTTQYILQKGNLYKKLLKGHSCWQQNTTKDIN